MYQQLHEAGRAPLIAHAAAPHARASSSSSPSPPRCPCCPSLSFPALFSERYSASFFLSASLQWLCQILLITATGVTDFIRFWYGNSISVWMGAWRVCQQQGAALNCSSLTVEQLTALGDAVPFDAFRAFLVLSVLTSFCAALLATVRLVVQQQRRRAIPRWADVLVLVTAVVACAAQLICFALFLDAFRSFRVDVVKTYGSSFVCLMVAFSAQCVAVIAHAVTWHFYANRTGAPGLPHPRSAGEPHAMPMAPMHAQQQQQQQAPSMPHPFNLPPPSSYEPFYGHMGYAPPPVHYGAGVPPALMYSASPFPTPYMPASYYPSSAAVLPGTPSSMPAPTMVHYGQGFAHPTATPAPSVP